MNKYNKEKVTKTVKDNKIKEEIIDLFIEFDSYTFNEIETRYLKNIFDINAKDQETFATADYNNLKNKTVEFFYSKANRNMYDNSKNRTKDLDNVNEYFLNCEIKLKKALNIDKIIKGYNQYIFVLDRCTDIKNIHFLPRYQKMKRLESFYDFIIEYGLKLIHQYYWEDFTLNKSSLLTLKECIQKTLPIIIELKHKFEDQVNDEFEYDNNEEKLMNTGRVYKKI